MTASPDQLACKQACVLLVEDDVTISDLLAYNLKRAGYSVLQEYMGRGGVPLPNVPANP